MQASDKNRREGEPGAVSGIILAGGRSSRMGTDKAQLPLGGQTLLERQAEKLRALGIDDILISGAAVSLPCARLIADRVPGCGPLGGLYACFSAAKHQNCLVLCVDVPLVPLRSLAELLEAHLEGDTDATLLEQGGFPEPLLGVYRAALAEQIAPLLRDGEFAVRAFLRRIRLQTVPYTGDALLLTNCNTPEDYRKLWALTEEQSGNCHFEEIMESSGLGAEPG